MPTKEELKYLQSLPLEAKVLMTKARIREWVSHYGTSGVYISFSGGKDSTVLLHLVREEWPDVEAVFVNTGLEYPEIQSFVKKFPNVTILRPKMRFDEVIKKYGYPLISKEVSSTVDYARRNIKNPEKHKWAADRINGKRLTPEGEKSRFNCDKYKPLLKTDFILSDECCKVMKKGPAHKFEKETQKYPIMATMAEESAMRYQQWLNTGCNSFDGRRKLSKPMSFWTEQDVLQYIKQTNMEIAPVYGQVIYDIEGDQLAFEGFKDALNGTLKCSTTGCDRTGCIFCGFGAHLDEYSRFVRLKETHPKQYNYCIGGENIPLTAYGSRTARDLAWAM